MLARFAGVQHAARSCAISVVTSAGPVRLQDAAGKVRAAAAAKSSGLSVSLGAQ